MASSASHVWKYQVYLSFRGEDTRRTFVDHFYTALEYAGISTCRDDETLPLGALVGASILKAIGESQIAIIIFSENYADSTECLDEVVHILRCKDTKGQIVIPIYYGVEPFDVRKQQRRYGEAFYRHMLQNEDRVESWRRALVAVSNLSGWATHRIADGYESKAIKEIVKDIVWMLDRPTKITSEDLIGMNARVTDLRSKLQIESGGVSMVGILGVGGGGKTALASSIYDEIHLKFDGSCFIKNILEISSDNGLEKLQEQILTRVLKEGKKQIGSVGEGRCMIKRSLCDKKVLIVLDDVDHLDHLQALAGSHDWFGEGSRIIITTRDKHVLTAHRVDVIHNIRLLNNDEAIGLFRKYAYPRYKPMEDYERSFKDVASIDVVSYAGGLPLALKVLGAFYLTKTFKSGGVPLLD